MPTVWIPPLVRRSTGAPERVRVPAGTLRQLIQRLEALYPGTMSELMDLAEDRIRPGTAVAIDGNTNHLGLIQQVAEDAEVHFIPAIGGGAGAGGTGPPGACLEPVPGADGANQTDTNR